MDTIIRVLFGTGKIIISLVIGLFFTAIFACFSGCSNMDDVDTYYIIFCICVGVGASIISICLLFGI